MSAPSDLSPDQVQAYESFVDITNWQQDPNLAVVLLRSVNWNVESAVTAHFDGRPLDEIVQDSAVSSRSSESLRSNNGSQRSNNPPTALMQELHEQELIDNRNIAPRVNPTRPLYAPRGGSEGSIIQTVLLSPLNLGYKMFNTLLYFLSWLFPFFPRLTGYYPANRAATHTGSETGDYAKNAAARFIRSFEESYGLSPLSLPSSPDSVPISLDASPSFSSDDAAAGSSSSSGANISSTKSSNRPTIPFFLGGYTEALEKAKADLKYLVIVLQSEEHDLTADFNRNVLLSRQVVDLLNREDIIFWAGNVQESEAYQVASGLDVTKFPFCALIAPSPRTPTSSILVMSVLIKLQGATLDANEFVSAIEERMEAHSPKILALVLDKQERDTARRLREEQDSAYERSLAADRDRQRKAQEERQKAEEEAKRREQEVKQEQERQELLIKNQNQWRRWRVSQLRQKLAVAEQSKSSARIGLRLLSGDRAIQRFSATDTIDDLYAFVECYDMIKKGDDVSLSSESSNEPPIDYNFVYGFQLVSPMPRKILNPSADSQIQNEPSLWPNGSLVVEEIEEDDE